MSSPFYQRIFANIVIPGKGDPIPNGIVIINNKTKKIEYVGNNSNEIPSTISQSSSFKDFKVNILMPGLWDCHVHFGGINSKCMESMKGQDLFLMGQLQPSTLCVARCIPQLKTALNYGITSVRDCGGYGLYLKILIKEGSFIGPNIYSAGQALSITGGHGDIHQLPLQFVCWNCKIQSNGCSTIVDGVNECLKETRKLFRQNADFIKIHATGGVLSQNDSLHHQQFSDDEIKCVVNEARRHNKVVAAHCHGRDGIKNCIFNNVHSIEHGTYLTDNLAKEMYNKNMVLVPTRWIHEYMNDNLENLTFLSDQSKKKFLKMLKFQRYSLKIAIRNNLRICMGTDMGLDLWGQNSKELEYYVNMRLDNGKIEKGMSELDAIKCATANGPYCLGNDENNIPKSGQIKIGYDADLIALNKNPLDDITVLQNEKNIIIVWKDGDMVKNQITSKL